MNTNNPSGNASQSTIVTIQSQKSMTTALLLSFFFGPLGMLYSTITGALIMFLLSVLAALFTFGIGLFFTWPVCMVWAAVAARNKSSKTVFTTVQSSAALFFVIMGFSLQGISQTTLNNTGVVQLHKKQVSKDIIINIIKSSETSFDLSVDSIIYLKGVGLPNEVLNEMLLTKSGNGKSNSAAKKSLMPGIYLLDQTTMDYKKLYPTVSSQSKSGGYLLTAMTYGIAKSKSKASIRGIESSVKIHESKPIFRFVFAATEENANDMVSTYFSQASSPNEFMMLYMDKRSNSREFVTGTGNSFSHSSGVDDKYVVAFDITDLGNGEFEVTPTANLKEGEYCFMYAGTVPNIYSAQATKVYDFSIR
ncbi:MAG: TM2 domain-containing protein [Bacteroidetes bacterium]|nr:TM2 domain-containing protein [Bacteroidota bacterium]